MNMGAKEIVLKMLKLFEEKYPRTYFKKNDLNFTRYSYIILASIIEKEAKLDDESIQFPVFITTG